MFYYRQQENKKSKSWEIISHDDNEMFRILGWNDRDKESRNLDHRIISIHNPAECFEPGVDSWFKDENQMVHYNFLFAGAGDTRKQRALFATDEVRREIIPYIMNGLTMDDVNRPINGKYVCSGLRFTTYESLWLTGSRRIQFDIDRCIVIKDIEFDVNYKARYVNAPEGFVSDDLKDVTKTMEITDGAGMFLPGTFRHRAFTARAPWFKGLMVEHDFLAAAYRTNNFVLKDAWGQDHDLIAEGINCIWTTSQLKLWKAYKNWDHYKRYFKQYYQHFCEALTPEHKHNLTLSYQPLQSLVATEMQTKKLITNNINKIFDQSGRKITRNGETIVNYKKTIKALGLNSIQVFNEFDRQMLNTPYGIKRVREYLQGRINHLRCGEIELQGYEPFVSPDWNYVCNVLFGDNAPTVPKGFVSCPYFDYGKQCDIIRYPHLYGGAHCIRTNTYVEGLNAPVVYADHDGITAILCEADFDGDHLQMFLNKDFIDIVSSEVNQVPPIYYECASGQKHPVKFDFSEHGIFTELRNSYAGKANVGVPSNWATRIFNSNLSKEEKDKFIPLLAHCVQGRIDYPKTGESYDIPNNMIKDITSKYELPAFMLLKKINEDKDRMLSKNRGIMSKIVQEVCGEGNYTPDREQLEEIKRLYNERRKSLTDFQKYGEPPTKDNMKYIMDYIWVMCDELEERLNLKNWYVPGDGAMFKLNSSDYHTQDRTPHKYAQFIKDCASKQIHLNYQERINAMTMVHPDPDIQKDTKELFKQTYTNYSLEKDFFERAVRDYDNNCIGFVLYLWPIEFLKWAKDQSCVEGLSMIDRKKKSYSKAGKAGDPKAKAKGGGLNAKRCVIVFDDTGESIIFNSVDEAVKSTGCTPKAIYKAMSEQRSFKYKSDNNRKAKLVILDD